MYLDPQELKLIRTRADLLASIDKITAQIEQLTAMMQFYLDEESEDRARAQIDLINWQRKDAAAKSIIDARNNLTWLKVELTRKYENTFAAGTIGITK